MDAPIESLPAIARERLETIEKRMGEHGATREYEATLLEKFWLGIGGPFAPWFIEKGMAEAEDFVVEWFTRDEDWVVAAAGILYVEAEITARSAIEAQLGSAFGKKLPDDFAFSQTQIATMRHRARESAISIANTWNKQISGWIGETKGGWQKKHGSLKGLNRWHIIRGVNRRQVVWSRNQNSVIATTEFSHPWRDAVSSFAEANPDIELECQILPEHASERDTPIFCREFAGKWFPMSEALSLVPQHINCIHYCGKSRNVGKIPAYIRLGNLGYGMENLGTK